MSNLANNTTTMRDILALINSLPEGGGGGFPNGTKWTMSNISNGNANCFCYANGVWVAGGENPKYSTDGKTWIACTAKSLPDQGEFWDFVGVTYANGIFVAASAFDCIWYSENGREWSWCPDTEYETFADVVYENGTWVALGSSSRTMWTSSDGISWVAGSTTFPSTPLQLIYASNKFILTTSTAGAYYSIDGTQWTQISGITKVRYVAYGSGLFVATTSNGIFYSRDGITWTQSNVTSNHLAVHHANGKWVAGGSAGNGLKFSDDGKVWTQSNVTAPLFRGIVHANGMWVAGSTTDGLWYSTNGEVWTQSNIAATNWRYVYNANGIWVAGGAGSDGIAYSVGWEPS